jgi:hypothetical protein
VRENSILGPTLMPQDKLYEPGELTRLKKLIVARNPRLESLRGIPVESFNYVSADSCCRHGDQTKHPERAAHLTRVNAAENYTSLVISR